MLDPAADYHNLGAFYEATAGRLDDPADLLFTAEADVSGWSVAQHLYHILRANASTLKAAYRLGTATPPLPAQGDPTREAMIVLRRGRLPKGAQAPASVRPPPDLDLDGLRASHRMSQRMLDRVEPLLPTILTLHGHLPHPLLGPLTAAQWLAFTRIHTAHHEAIIRQIEAAQAAPPL
ncbi:MAG: DinB family protein [Bacteroidota bacterium]